MWHTAWITRAVVGLLICPTNTCQRSVATPLEPRSGSPGSDRCQIISFKRLSSWNEKQFTLVCKVNLFNPKSHAKQLCVFISSVSNWDWLLGSCWEVEVMECAPQLRFLHPYEIPLQRWVAASWKRPTWNTPGICINSCLKALGGLAAHCLEKALPRTHLLLSAFISSSFHLSVLLKAAEQTWWLSCAGF